MKIRVAKLEDITSIISLIEASIEHMNNNGIYQWDSVYPNDTVLKQDIIDESLFVIEDEKNILGIVALNEHQDPEYDEIDWKHKSDKILVVHRLSVHPDSQGKGIAKRLMDFAEKYADENKYFSIRLDAFKDNKIAVSLYENRDYDKVGVVTFRKGLFYCFEKRIDMTE